MPSSITFQMFGPVAPTLHNIVFDDFYMKLINQWITSRLHGQGPFMTRVSMLAVESGNIFICKILNKTKFHSNKEALKIPLIHFLAYLMLICC